MLEPDRSQLEIFVDAIFRHASTKGFVSVRSFVESEDRAFRITSVRLSGGLPFLIDVAEDDSRRAAQNPKAVVFCPPLATFQQKNSAREQDLLEGLALSVECDQHPQLAHKILEELIGPATVIVRSGGVWQNGGTEPEDKLHLHWRLRRPAQGNDLTKLKQARDLAARLVDGDPSNKPVCHPIRWPGSWHRKAEPRLCMITELQADVEIDLDATLLKLQAAAPQPGPARNSATAGPSEPEAEWTKLVDDIVTGKSYHGSLVSLAARLVGSNTHDGTTVKLLRGLMNASIGEHDARRWQVRYDSIPQLVASARAKYGRPEVEPTNAAEITLHWHGEANTKAPRSWLVEGLLPQTGTGLLAGQWGTYKTFCALDLAAAVMAGETFIEFPIVRRAGVLFIAPEGASEIDTRLQAVLDAKYPELQRAPFAWIDVCPRLIEDRATEILSAIAQRAVEHLRAQFDLPLGLIVIDTVVAAAGFGKSEENDAAANQMVMNRMAALARATGAFVIGVDHFGKNADTGTRGSSAKEGAADVVLALLGKKSVEGTVSNTRLAVRKNRSGPSGQEFPFTTRVVDLIDEEGRPESSLVLDWAPTQTQAGRKKNDATTGSWSKSLQVLRRALMGVLADQGQEIQPFNNGPTVRAADLEYVRGQFYSSYPADGDEAQKKAARRKAFGRAVKDANDRGLIGVRDLGSVTFIWFARIADEHP